MEQRIIKFRGKRIDNGEWVYGDLITTPIHHDCVILENGCINHAVDRKTVGQCTGLPSKSGEYIYEGDILKTFWQHDGSFASKDPTISGSYVGALGLVSHNLLFPPPNPGERGYQAGWVKSVHKNVQIHFL